MLPKLMKSTVGIAIACGIAAFVFFLSLRLYLHETEDRGIMSVAPTVSSHGSDGLEELQPSAEDLLKLPDNEQAAGRKEADKEGVRPEGGKIIPGTSDEATLIGTAAINSEHNSDPMVAHLVALDAANPVSEAQLSECGPMMRCWIHEDLEPGQYVISIRKGQAMPVELVPGRNDVFMDLRATYSAQVRFVDAATGEAIIPGAVAYFATSAPMEFGRIPETGTPLFDVVMPREKKLRVDGVGGTILYLSVSATGYQSREDTLSLSGEDKLAPIQDVYMEPALTLAVQVLDAHGQEAKMLTPSWVETLQLQLEGRTWSPSSSAMRGGRLYATYDSIESSSSDWTVIPPKGFTVESIEDGLLGPGIQRLIVLQRR